MRQTLYEDPAPNPPPSITCGGRALGGECCLVYNHTKQDGVRAFTCTEHHGSWSYVHPVRRETTYTYLAGNLPPLTIGLQLNASRIRYEIVTPERTDG